MIVGNIYYIFPTSIRLSGHYSFYCYIMNIKKNIQTNLLKLVT